MNTTLFHISYDHHSIIKAFTPYVPFQRAHGENSTIPRICTSGSIEGCFQGSPHTDMLFVEGGLVDDETYDIYLTADTEYNGVPVILYEFNVPESMVKSPEEISHYVPDAMESNEHWIMEETAPSKISYLLLEDAVYDKEKGNQFFYVKLTKEQFDGLILHRND